MKTLIIALSLCLLIPSSAEAQKSSRWCRLGAVGDGGKVIDSKPMDGAAGTRTFTFGTKSCGDKTSSYSYLVIEMEFTHATNGNMILTCTNGQTTGTADKSPQVCGSITAGVCVAEDAAIVKKGVTGDKNWSFRIGIKGYRAWSCIASHDGGPAAGDILTTYAYVTD